MRDLRGGEQHGRSEPRRLDDVVAGEAIDDDAVGCLEAGDRY